MAELRKYGVSATVQFPLIDFGATDFEDTPVTFAAGDTQVSKDGAAFANTTNNPTHIGNGVYQLVLTATEMQAARVAITIVDQTATKTWEDQGVNIDTYGNASAQHAVDLDDGVRAGLTALPNANAGASGGLPVRDGAGLIDVDVINIAGTAATLSGGNLDVNVESIDTTPANTIRDAVTGGAYSLDTDSNGRIRVVDGTGAGEISLTSGAVDQVGNVQIVGPGAIAMLSFQASSISAGAIAAAALNGKGDWSTEDPSTELSNIGLDHLISAAVAGTDVTDGSIVAHLAASGATPDWDTFDNETDSLQAIRDRGDAAWTTGAGGSAPTVEEIADGVWDELLSGHTTAGSAGLTLSNASTLVQTDIVSGGAINTTAGAVDQVGNVQVKTGYALSSNGMDAVILPDNIITSSSVAASAANKVADHSRRRTQQNVEASSDGDALSLNSAYGQIQQIQRGSASDTAITVKQTDGSALGTLPIDKDASADPVTRVGDP